MSLLIAPRSVPAAGYPFEIGATVVPQKLTITINLSDEPDRDDAVEVSQSFSLADALTDKGLVGALVRSLKPSATA